MTVLSQKVCHKHLVAMEYVQPPYYAARWRCPWCVREAAERLREIRQKPGRPPPLKAGHGRDPAEH